MSIDDLNFDRRFFFGCVDLLGQENKNKTHYYKIVASNIIITTFRHIRPADEIINIHNVYVRLYCNKDSAAFNYFTNLLEKKNLLTDTFYI